MFIAKYTTQTAVNKTVQALLRLLIGWSIPLTCAVTTFYILDGVTAYKEYNSMWPALIVFISSFIIADGICTVYDCCIDTIYLLSFEDMEREGGPNFMSDELRAGFGLDCSEKESSDAAKKYKVGAPPIAQSPPVAWPGAPSHQSQAHTHVSRRDPRRRQAVSVRKREKKAGKVTVLKVSDTAGAPQTSGGTSTV